MICNGAIQLTAQELTLLDQAPSSAPSHANRQNLVRAKGRIALAHFLSLLYAGSAPESPKTSEPSHAAPQKPMSAADWEHPSEPPTQAAPALGWDTHRSLSAESQPLCDKRLDRLEQSMARIEAAVQLMIRQSPASADATHFLAIGVVWTPRNLR